MSGKYEWLEGDIEVSSGKGQQRAAGESRMAGLGGQFAKGGGRVQGKASAEAIKQSTKQLRPLTSEEALAVRLYKGGLSSQINQRDGLDDRPGIAANITLSSTPTGAKATFAREYAELAGAPIAESDGFIRTTSASKLTRTEVAVEITRRLDSAVTSSVITAPLTVYRGVPFKTSNALSDSGFASVTTNRDIAVKFAEKRGTVLTATLQPGSSVLVIGGAWEKAELLLPRGSVLQPEASSEGRAAGETGGQFAKGGGRVPAGTLYAGDAKQGGGSIGGARTAAAKRAPALLARMSPEDQAAMVELGNDYMRSEAARHRVTPKDAAGNYLPAETVTTPERGITLVVAGASFAADGNLPFVKKMRDAAALEFPDAPGMSKYKPSGLEDNLVGPRRALLRARYEESQAILRERGITEVEVFRGVGTAHADTSLASWSTDRGIAEHYAKVGAMRSKSDPLVLRATVPAGQVFGWGKEGWGLSADAEVVVIGNPVTENRAAGGQFAKGGGRVPGKGGSDAAWEAKHGQARPVGDGNCHAVAGQYVLDHNDGQHVLAQGVPTGQGKIAGTKFDHSWVERTESDGSVTVVEKSNGNDLELPAPAYYAIGRIDKASVLRFTPDQILDKIDETGTWGPWDS